MTYFPGVITCIQIKRGNILQEKDILQRKISLQHDFQ